jgi:ribose 5-phosphate isomerase B
VKIALGSDHAGFAAKARIGAALARAGHDVVDVGASSTESVDYPDFAAAVARAVAQGRVERGILVCGTGIGMAIAANKVRGVRAAVVWSPETARLCAEHNGVNVLCLAGRLFPAATLVRWAKAWLATPFGGDRHARRLKKIAALERGRS